MLLLPRWATRSPPHPSPPVTASPQGEASGLCSPTRKKRPKSGHVHGHRNSPSTGTMWHPTPKRASANERPLTQGGGGSPVLRTLGAQRPGGPACPAGVPISPEKWGERGPGLRPWTPGFMARSLSFARFGDRCLWYDSGAVTSGMLRPIWDAFSRKNMLKSIFAKESLQIRARTWVAK